MAGYNDPFKPNPYQNDGPYEGYYGDEGYYGGDAGRKGYEGTNPDGSPSGQFYGGHDSARARDVKSYGDLSNWYGGRQAATANTDDYQYGLGAQRDAMDLTQETAMGNVKSPAQKAAEAGVQQSNDANIAIGSSARGGAMQQAISQQRAKNVNAGADARMNAGIQAGRANEMEAARNQLGQQALAYGQAGLAKSAQDIQNEQAQRELNQKGQQYAAQAGWNVNQAAVNAAGMRTGAQQSAWNADQGDRNQDENRNEGAWLRAVNQGSSAGSSASKVFSDERTKDFQYGRGR